MSSAFVLLAVQLPRYFTVVRSLLNRIVQSVRRVGVEQILTSMIATEQVHPTVSDVCHA